MAKSKKQQSDDENIKRNFQQSDDSSGAGRHKDRTEANSDDIVHDIITDERSADAKDSTTGTRPKGMDA